MQSSQLREPRKDFIGTQSLDFRKYFFSNSFILFSAQDLETKKQHIPLVDRTPLEPPPIVVAIVGPPKVGKTTLLQALIKNFTRQNITSIQGPVTVVIGNY